MSTATFVTGDFSASEKKKKKNKKQNKTKNSQLLKISIKTK